MEPSPLTDRLAEYMGFAQRVVLSLVDSRDSLLLCASCFKLVPQRQRETAIEQLKSASLHPRAHSARSLECPPRRKRSS